MNGQAGAVALLTAAVVCVSGCGGGDDSTGFRTDYNRVVRQYSTLPVEVGAAIRGASAMSDKELETQFGGLADRVEQEAGKLRKLNPPDGANDEFDAFVRGLGKVGDDLRAISDAGRSHSSKRATAAAGVLVRDAKAVSTEESSLRRAVD